MSKATKEIRYTCYAFLYPGGAEHWLYINHKYLADELAAHVQGSIKMKRPASGLGTWDRFKDN